MHRKMSRIFNGLLFFNKMFSFISYSTISTPTYSSINATFDPTPYRCLHSLNACRTSTLSRLWKQRSVRVSRGKLLAIFRNGVAKKRGWKERVVISTDRGKNYLKRSERLFLDFFLPPPPRNVCTRRWVRENINFCLFEMKALSLKAIRSIVN